MFTVRHTSAATSVLLLSCVSAFASGGNFDRRLSVSGDPTVSIATGAGYIHLRAGSDDEVHVSAHLYSNGNGWWGGGGASGNMQSRIDAISQNPPIRQEGNQISIGQIHGDDRFQNVTIDYEVTLPRQSHISASTGSGDIESQDVGSALQADSGSGSVRIHNAHGVVTLKTGSGDVELEHDDAGELHAQTGSGSIRLRQIDGPVHAQTGSGDIEISGQITGDSRLQTGSGSVRLVLGPNARYTLDAITGSGSVRTDPPLAVRGELNQHHFTGTVNGGGPTLRLVTGSGDIEIH